VCIYSLLYKPQWHTVLSGILLFIAQNWFNNSVFISLGPICEPNETSYLSACTLLSHSFLPASSTTNILVLTYLGNILSASNIEWFLYLCSKTCECQHQMNLVFKSSLQHSVWIPVYASACIFKFSGWALEEPHALLYTSATWLQLYPDRLKFAVC
jgi:hypothetical protein